MPRQYNRKFLAAMSAALLVCLVLGACTSTSAARRQNTSLAGDWLFVSLIQADAAEPAPEGTLITLNITPFGGQQAVFRATGFSGVNNYAATITITRGTAIQMGTPAITMASNDDTNAAFENTYLAMLAQMQRYAVGMHNGEPRLVLTDSGGNFSMQFTRDIFSNTQWKLDAYMTDNRGIQSVDARSENAPSISFNPGGRLTGFSGVNRISAQYRMNTANRTLSISQPAATRIAPPDEKAADIEAHLLAALPQTQSYQIRNDSLTFLNGDGHILLTFTRN